MSKLTGEQIRRIELTVHGYTRQPLDVKAFARAIEAAATEPLLKRIEELEEMNAQLREQNTEVDKACAELEQQLAEARKDAERYRWLRDLDEDPILSLAAQYTDMNGSATSISQRIDATIDAAMQNDNPVGVVFQKGQA